MITTEGSVIKISVEDLDGTKKTGSYLCDEEVVEKAACHYRNMIEGLSGETVLCEVDFEDMISILGEDGFCFLIESSAVEIEENWEKFLDKNLQKFAQQGVLMRVECDSDSEISMTDITEWMELLVCKMRKNMTIFPSVSYRSNTGKKVNISLWFAK